MTCTPVSSCPQACAASRRCLASPGDNEASLPILLASEAANYFLSVTTLEPSLSTARRLSINDFASLMSDKMESRFAMPAELTASLERLPCSSGCPLETLHNQNAGTQVRVTYTCEGSKRALHARAGNTSQVSGPTTRSDLLDPMRAAVTSYDHDSPRGQQKSERQRH